MCGGFGGTKDFPLAYHNVVLSCEDWFRRHPNAPMDATPPDPPPTYSPPISSTPTGTAEQGKLMVYSYILLLHYYILSIYINILGSARQ